MFNPFLTSGSLTRELLLWSEDSPGVSVWSRAALGLHPARWANHSLINIHDSSHLAAALGTGAALLLVLEPWRALSKAGLVLSWAAAPAGHPSVVLSSSWGMPASL